MGQSPSSTQGWTTYIELLNHYFIANNVDSKDKKVEAELARLQSMGVISAVESSQWAAPIVPVVKKGTNMRGFRCHN